MNRIEERFKALRRSGKKAFIAFVTAGYPSLAATLGFIIEFERSGVDIIELGVPFSDPLADGPIIQAASEHALKRGVNIGDVFRLVKAARARGVRVPICLMTYFNPVFCHGVEKCARDAGEAGVDGFIIPDLPPDEERPAMKSFRDRGIDVICFISPTTDRRRARYIARVAHGFIYYVSLTGVTGPRAALPSDVRANVTAVKRLTRTPVCAGFGVSTPRHVADIGRFADGVIVGSAIVDKVARCMGKPGMIGKVGVFVRSLKGAAVQPGREMKHNV